jgi:hypothetical protein
MAAWLIRSTKQVLESGSPNKVAARLGVDASELVDGNGNAVTNTYAIWQPDLSAVTGFASKYWIVGAYPDDNVTLMDQAARDALDAAELDAELQSITDQVDQNRDLTIALGLVLLDFINIERAEHQRQAGTRASLKSAVLAKLQELN